MDSYFLSFTEKLQDSSFVDSLIEAYLNYPLLHEGVMADTHPESQKNFDEFWTKTYYDWVENMMVLSYCKKGSDISYIERRVYPELWRYHPKTKEDVLHFFEGKIADSTCVNDFLGKNRFDMRTDWSFKFDNSFFNGHNSKPRLYVNCDPQVTHFICQRIIHKCTEKKISFSIKLNHQHDRSDKVSILCTMDHYGEFVDILNEIKKETNFGDTIYQPPLLSSCIDGWIGFGIPEEFLKLEEQILWTLYNTALYYYEAGIVVPESKEFMDNLMLNKDQLIASYDYWKDAQKNEVFDFYMKSYIVYLKKHMSDFNESFVRFNKEICFNEEKAK